MIIQGIECRRPKNVAKQDNKLTFRSSCLLILGGCHHQRIIVVKVQATRLSVIGCRTFSEARASFVFPRGSIVACKIQRIEED